jgi:hypothetical protein
VKDSTQHLRDLVKDSTQCLRDLVKDLTQHLRDLVGLDSIKGGSVSFFNELDTEKGTMLVDLCDSFFNELDTKMGTLLVSFLHKLETKKNYA